MLIICYSFPAVFLEEPNDPHGTFLYGHDFRNALSDGEQYVTLLCAVRLLVSFN